MKCWHETRPYVSQPGVAADTLYSGLVLQGGDFSPQDSKRLNARRGLSPRLNKFSRCRAEFNPHFFRMNARKPCLLELGRPGLVVPPAHRGELCWLQCETPWAVQGQILSDLQENPWLYFWKSVRWTEFLENPPCHVNQGEASIRLLRSAEACGSMTKPGSKSLTIPPSRVKLRALSSALS